jgi:hypothetical protein
VSDIAVVLPGGDFIDEPLFVGDAACRMPSTTGNTNDCRILVSIPAPEPDADTRK